MKSCRRNSLHLCFLLLFPPFFLAGIPANASDQAVTISVSAEMLKEVISDALPIPLETSGSSMKGDIVIDSMSDLRVNENSIFLAGVVLGENLSMHTRIAGQDISMVLRSMRIPVTCELFPRFDKAKKILYVTPYFSNTEKGKNLDITDALFSLLSPLSDKEYPVELNSLQPITMRIGNRDISVKLEPVDIRLQEGLLVVKLRQKAN
jgi:hypothetical protein